jgi:hypothetical protein
VRISEEILPSKLFVKQNKREINFIEREILICKDYLQK